MANASVNAQNVQRTCKTQCILNQIDTNQMHQMRNIPNDRPEKSVGTDENMDTEFKYSNTEKVCKNRHFSADDRINLMREGGEGAAVGT